MNSLTFSTENKCKKGQDMTQMSPVTRNETLMTYASFCVAAGQSLGMSICNVYGSRETKMAYQTPQKKKKDNYNSDFLLNVFHMHNDTNQVTSTSRF